MANVNAKDPVPVGKTRFFETKQQPVNEKGYVGYHTEWMQWQKEVPYETPKRP